MNGFLWAAGGATVIIAGVMSYAVTRRYGWGAALALPVVALAAVVAIRWQDQGLGFAEGLGLIGAALVFAAPVLLGALVGIAFGAWRRR
jgi:hypothetical protein